MDQRNNPSSAAQSQHLQQLRALILAVGYIAVWIGLWDTSNWFNLATGISLWYPPAGMTFAILLEWGWRGLLLSIFAALFAGLSIWSWEQWPYYLMANLIPPLGYVMAAHTLRGNLSRHQRNKGLFNDPQQVAAFIGAATGGALFAALTGTEILHSAKLLPPAQSRLELIMGWWLGDLIAVLTIAPLVLIFATPLARYFYAGKPLHLSKSLLSADPPSVRLIIFQILFSVQLVIGLFWVPHYFWHDLPDPFMTLLLLPVLAWIVATHSMRGTALTVFFYELGIVMMVVLFGQTDHAFQYQIVMAVVVASGLLTGAVSHVRLTNMARFRDLAEVSNDWLWEFDASGRLCDLGGRFAKFASLHDSGWSSTSWRDYIIPQRQDTDLIALKAAIRRQQSFQQLVLRIRLPGQERLVWTLNSGLPLFDEDGEFSGYRGATTDITDRKQAELLLRDYDQVLEAKVAERTRILVESSRRAWQLANFDSLTGLPNRNLLFEHLLRGLQQAHRQRQRLALLLLDLDGFKPVNDTLGHDAGDQLLRQVAERLRQCVRAVDTVARLGGDEFVIILSDLEDGQSAAVVARKISAAIAEPILLGDTTAKVTASIGIALHYPDQPVDMNRALGLLKRADQAMYAAKRAGKDIWRFADNVDPNQDTSPSKQPSVG